MNSAIIGSPWVFSEGMAAVVIKNHMGFINRNGNVEIEPKFTGADGFSEGLAAVAVKNKYGFIDRYGTMVLEPKYDFALAFSEGLAYARIGDTHGYINYSGNFEFQKPVPKPTLIDKLRGRKDWLRW